MIAASLRTLYAELKERFQLTAADLPQPPAVVLGVGEGFSNAGAHWSQQSAFTSTPQEFSAPPAFAMAGVTPADVDVLTVYDPFRLEVADSIWSAAVMTLPFIS